MLHFIQVYAINEILLATPIYLFIVAYKIIHIKKLKRSGHFSLIREVFITAFLLYMTTLLAITVINFNTVHGNGVFGFYNFLNVIPFKRTIENFIKINQLSRGDRLSLLVNLFGNLAMFVPFGFLVPSLWDIKPHRVILLGASLSLLIEILQLPFLRGSDIDDIILNTLGAIIGYAVYVLLRNKNFIKSLKKAEKTA